MTRTITLPADQAPDILRATAGQALKDADLGQLPLFDGDRPRRIRVTIAGTITLTPVQAAELANIRIGSRIHLPDIADEAVLVAKKYARPLDKNGWPSPLEQTITLRITDPAQLDDGDDDQEEAR